MEPESSLPHWQAPAICPYPEPDQSSPCPIPLFKYHFNIIFPSAPRYSKWSLSLRSPHQNLYTPLLPPIHAKFILLYLIPRTIFGEQYRSLSSSLRSFLHSPVASSLLDPNISIRTLFSKTLSLCSSLGVTDQVSHPYKPEGKTTVLYILIFIFLDS